MKRVQGCPRPLGMTRTGNRVNFSVAVPEKSSCDLILYSEQYKNPKRFSMPYDPLCGEVRCLGIEEAPEDLGYLYEKDGVSYPDPHAKRLVFSDTEEILRCGLPQTFAWEEDRPLSIPEHQVIAYSLHVRGFTKHPSSRVRQKGTFAGVREKIPYLKDLGINQIHCMPVYEFQKVQGKKVNYWGYGPGYFFAPNHSYAGNEDAAGELKQMILDCHRSGIEVILSFPFSEGIRISEMLHCLEYYRIEYHVDGFLINPYLLPWEQVASDPLLQGAKLYRKDETFQNVMRRFLKGDEGMIGSVEEQLRRHAGSEGAFNYITDHTGFTLQDLVSYEEKHNEANGEKNQDGPDYNYSWNCGAEGPTRKETVLALRKQQVRNAFALLLLAQGVPCILSGDEFGNSQKGNNNVYCQDNATAWLNWNSLNKGSELYEEVKALIAFRKKWKILHQDRPLLRADVERTGLPDLSYHGTSAWMEPNDVASRLLGVLYSRKNENGEQEACYVAYNMHWLDHIIALPVLPGKKTWYLAVDGEKGVLKRMKVLKNQRELVIKARTIQVLVSR